MPAPVFEVYPRQEVVGVRDRQVQTRPSGYYGWRFRDGNGEIQTVSEKDYDSREEAAAAIVAFGLAFGDAIGMPEVSTALDVGSRTMPVAYLAE